MLLSFPPDSLPTSWVSKLFFIILLLSPSSTGYRRPSWLGSWGQVGSTSHVHPGFPTDTFRENTSICSMSRNPCGTIGFIRAVSSSMLWPRCPAQSMGWVGTYCLLTQWENADGLPDSACASIKTASKETIENDFERKIMTWRKSCLHLFWASPYFR